MSYNLTFVDSSNTLHDLFSGFNIASSYIPFMLFIAILWIGIYSITQRSGGSDSFTVASFSTAVIASLMFFAGYLPWYLTIVPVMMTVLGVVVKGFQK